MMNLPVDLSYPTAPSLGGLQECGCGGWHDGCGGWHDGRGGWHDGRGGWHDGSKLVL